MINDYKISSLSFTLMFICIINALLPGTLFPYMIYEAKTSVFISILINYFIGLVMILLFIKLFNYLPSESIFGKIKKIFPNIKLFSILVESSFNTNKPLTAIINNGSIGKK